MTTPRTPSPGKATANSSWRGTPRANAKVSPALVPSTANGSPQTGPQFDVAMVRYNTDGSLDTTFGTGGRVAPFGPYDPAFAAVLQTDGKILVAGSIAEGMPFSSPTDFSLRRFNTNGSLDTT